MKLLLLPILLITGCATTENVVYKDVLVPVPTKCSVLMPERNIYLSDTLNSENTIFEKMKYLLIDKKSSKMKEDELRELLKVCIN